jgi:predicted RND superfamily exporter protein
MSRFWLSYLRAPWLTLGLLSAVTVALGLRAAEVPIDSSVEALVVEGDPDRVFFDAFQDHFESHEFLVVAMSSHRIFTARNLSSLADLTESLKAVDGVNDVTSLTTVEDIIGTEEDFFVGPFIEEIPETEEALRELRITALGNPLYRDGLVSADAKTASAVVELEPGLGGQGQSRTIDAIDRVADSARFGARMYLAGKPVLDHFAALSMKEDLRRFIPLTIALMAVILWTLLRNWFGVALPLLAMGLCMAWAVGFLGILGGTINNITTILPPLMMSIAVAVAVHLVTTYQDNLASARFGAAREKKTGVRARPAPAETGAMVGGWVRRLRGEKPPAKFERGGAEEDVAAWTQNLKGDRYSLSDNRHVVAQTIVQLWKPCLVSSLTTAAGFVSLVVSDVPPMRDFGLAASTGVLFSLIIVFGLLPAAWLLVRRPVARGQDLLRRDWMDGFLLYLSSAVERQPRRVLLLTGLLALLAGLGTTHLRIETNLLEYFQSDTRLVRDTEFIEAALSGVEDIRVSLRGDDPQVILSLDNLRRMEDLHGFLLSLPGVDKVTSVVDYLKDMHQSFHGEDRAYYRLPDSDELIAQYMLLYDGKDLHLVLDEDHQWASVYVRVHDHSSARLRHLITVLRQYLGEHFPDSVEAQVTGPTVLVTNLVDTLLASQIESLALASGVVFCMVATLFRSLRVGLLAMVPNLLPILLNLGLMGWVGIPLDTATAMISAVAIGIAVDDTVHFLAGYQHELAGGATVPQAIRRVYATKGRAIVYTSLILTAAFGVVMVSNFLPTRHFGALSALTMISALIADLLFLPALLLTTKLRP